MGNKEEYIAKVKNGLTHCLEWQANLGFLRQEIIEKRAMLKIDPAPKTTHWSEQPGGGGFEKPSMEQLALERKERLQKDLARLENEYWEKKRFLDRVDRSISLLPGMERKIVQARRGYRRDRESWTAIAVKTGMSEKFCRDSYETALSRLAGMIYGPEASPVQGVICIDQSTDQKNVLDEK